MKLSYALISIWFYLMAVCIALIFMPMALPLWVFSQLFDKKLKILHFYTGFWTSLYIWLNPFWRVKIFGRKKIQKGKKYVIVSNHQSMVDILVLYRLNKFFKWVSKEENFKVPIIGWMLSLNKYVKIRRGSQLSVKKMLSDCSNYLEQNVPLLVFPEGTRSETGQMRRFKDGAFRIAKNAGAPILPVVLDNTGKAVPKKGFMLRGRQRMTVKVLDEIPAKKVNEMSIEELKKYAFSIMASELENIRKQNE